MTTEQTTAPITYPIFLAVDVDDETKELWALSATDTLHVHSRELCPDLRNGVPCAYHAPTAHHMRTWPLRWRWYGPEPRLERVCPHLGMLGSPLGHPDPDYRGATSLPSHPCDGCCRAVAADDATFASLGQQVAAQAERVVGLGAGVRIPGIHVKRGGITYQTPPSEMTVIPPDLGQIIRALTSSIDALTLALHAKRGGPVERYDNPATGDADDGAFLARLGVDGGLWAQELGKATGLDSTPGGLLHGWVCNMIEAGRSAGYGEARRETPALTLESIETWLKKWREEYRDPDGQKRNPWYTVDGMLDDFRLHMQTGTPLDQPAADGPHGGDDR